MRNRKEQEEAVRRLNRYIIYIKSCGNTQSKHFKAVVIVLNMLKEKDAEIEKYNKLLADNLAKDLNNSIKAKHKADTDLDDLDKGWKVELEKKDKMIDLMTEQLSGMAIWNNEKEESLILKDKKEVKQHFARKATNDGQERQKCRRKENR